MNDEPITRGEFELLVSLERSNAERIAYFSQVLAMIALGVELSESQLGELRRALDDEQSPLACFDDNRAALRARLLSSAAR